jgi:hypothetical protein
MTQWTPLSIGHTMKGIAAKPTMVGIHLYDGGTTCIAFDAARRLSEY